MGIYRKKPVVIEAIIWNGNNHHEITEFCRNSYYFSDDNKELFIPTLEGDHKADIGDYVIKGIKNEFYPCKANIFELTYDKVEER